MGTTLIGTAYAGSRAVHPHARGDDENWGSGCWRRRRFTPTRVGTTQVARGVLVPVLGSPPRAWGRLRGDPSGGGLLRFTPTRVGTTTWRRSFGPPMSVHPHARGDDGSAGMLLKKSCGSPPRAWGRRDPITRLGVLRRFTPTRVGTTFAQGSACAGSAVHPHARGDDAQALSCGRPRTPVHPHARGDDTAAPIRRAHQSVHPHARGEDCSMPLRQRSRRFTPTRVGTTTVSRGGLRRSSVHPHARGEDERDGVCAAAAGSPPRAWGRRGW